MAFSASPTMFFLSFCASFVLLSSITSVKTKHKLPALNGGRQKGRPRYRRLSSPVDSGCRFEEDAHKCSTRLQLSSLSTLRSNALTNALQIKKEKQWCVKLCQCRHGLQTRTPTTCPVLSRLEQATNPAPINVTVFSSQKAHHAYGIAEFAASSIAGSWALGYWAPGASTCPRKSAAEHHRLTKLVMRRALQRTP
ncbi:hypothetical protein IWX50DRAFT_682355 [Phyllosticta citricarpa]|uniref:Secreted protein n=1 Tax=Phyllosticta citricarpa TaxID=55181 RepID=A0ABR1LG69_9PEZI